MQSSQVAFISALCYLNQKGREGCDAVSSSIGKQWASDLVVMQSDNVMYYYGLSPPFHVTL